MKASEICRIARLSELIRRLAAFSGTRRWKSSILFDGADAWIEKERCCLLELLSLW